MKMQREISPMPLFSQKRLWAISENAATQRRMNEWLSGSALIMLIAFAALSNISAGVLLQEVTVSSWGTISNSLILPLHVEGRYIKNSEGQIVSLKGINKVEFADDPDGWWGSDLWTDANVKAELDVMKTWGINVIRCHLAVENWKYNLGPTSNHPSAFHSAIANRDAIKRLLSFAAERGMYVVLDGYCVVNYYNGATQDPLPYPPYSTSPNAALVIANEQEFVDWWISVANELKGYSNVIFELWNEPEGDAAAKASWFSVAQRCINAIRGTGSRNLIVFQWRLGSATNLDFPYPPLAGLDWIREANLNDTEGNIVYSTHLYRSWGGIHRSFPSPQWNVWNFSDVNLGLESMGYYDIASTYPLFIGEIGANMAYSGTELEHELEFFNIALTLFNQHGIHYAGFWWRDIGVFALYSGSFSPNQAGIILKAAIAKTSALLP